MIQKICMCIIVICTIIDIFFIFALNKPYVSIYDELPFNSIADIEKYNSKIDPYRGVQYGKKLTKLIDVIKLYTEQYEDNPNVFPIVNCQIMDSQTLIQIEANYSKTKDLNSYIDKLNLIKNNMEINHKYNISFDYTNMGYIGQINILY